MYRLAKYCCCCDLRNGAIITIGFTFLNAVYNVIITIKSFMAQETLNELVQLMKAQELDPSGIKKNVLLDRVVGIWYSVFNTVACVCLILALVKNSSGFVIPWLLGAIISEIFMIVSCVFAFVNKNFVFGVAYLIAGCLITYFWLCMYSFYVELKEGPLKTR